MLYVSKARVSDVDVAVALVPRERDGSRQEQLEQERVADAEEGRLVRSDADAFLWPRHEVRRFLKSRSRGLNVHDISELERLGNVPTLTIFDASAERSAAGDDQR